MDRRNWLALHIFYHDAGKFDDLLLSGITPVMNQLLQDKWCESWFFIRYWEGGPHIRLRLLNPHPDAETVLRDRIGAYIAAHPSMVELERQSFYITHKLDGQPKENLDTYPWYANGSIVQLPYEPEFARYGGEDRIAIAEQFFQASSEVAVSAIAASKDSNAKRMGISFDLLIGFILSLTSSKEKAAILLKHYAQSWSFYTQAISSITQQAEIDYSLRRSHLKSRVSLVESKQVLSDDKAARSLHALWNSHIVQAKQQLELSGLEVEQAMMGIFFSQIHMTNNRLGMTPEQEIHLAYLGYLTLLDPITEHDSYNPIQHDLMGADVIYHEKSKFSPGLTELQKPHHLNYAAEHEAKHAKLQELQRIPLYPINSLLPLEMKLVDALAARRSCYGQYTGTMNLRELSTLLHTAMGNTGTMTIPIDSEHSHTMHVKAYPSGGGMYPVQIVFYANRVEGLTPGLYQYDADTHAVYKLHETGAHFMSEMLQTSIFTYPKETAVVDVEEAPLLLYLVANLSDMNKKYGLRSYRLILAECGHIAQNVCLVSTAMHYLSLTIGGFYDDLVNRLLDLDGEKRSVMYCLPVGKKYNKSTIVEVE